MCFPAGVVYSCPSGEYPATEMTLSPSSRGFDAKRLQADRGVVDDGVLSEHADRDAVIPESQIVDDVAQAYA